MNLKEIREILALMNENDLMEIEVEREGSKLKLKKSSPDFVEMVPRQQVSMPSQERFIAPPVESAPSSSAVSSSGRLEIKSPMVGTFYRSPSPEAPPYIDIGQMVEVGQVVCIVEAMKLMNEIKSEVRGKVVEIKSTNAQPVEYGQTLYVVEPV